MLTAPDPAIAPQFGSAVALSGDTALIGAYYQDVGDLNEAGVAYVFTGSGSDWTQQAELTPGDAVAHECFGQQVALSGDVALIGAEGGNDCTNCAYVFSRSGGDWTQQSRLVAPQEAVGFADSLALDGTTGVVAAELAPQTLVRYPITYVLDVLDDAPPVTTATGLSANPDPDLTKNATVSLSAADVGSGVATTYYSIDGGARQTYQGPFAVSGDGLHTVSYSSVDIAGNVENTAVGYLNLDTTAPVTTATGLSATLGPAWSRNATVSLSAVDGGSGVATTHYSIDGGTQQTYQGPFTVSGDGPHTVSYWSVDVAGNVEGTEVGYLDLDATAPVTTATGLSANPAPDWSKNATVSLSADDSKSGVAATYYSIDGGAQQTYQGPFALSDGVHTVTYWSVDAVGNAEATHTGYADIDTIGPTTYAATAAGHKGRPIALRYLVRDNLSNLATDVTLTVRNSHRDVVARIRLETKSTAAWHAASWKPKARGSYTYTVTADDLAGNPQVKAGSARISVK